MGERLRRVLIAFVAAALASAAAWSGAAAQTAPSPRVGVLAMSSAGLTEDTVYWAAFRDGMAKLGYVEGGNVVYEWRWADNDYRRLSPLARDLVALHVNVIVGAATPAVIAARAATAEIPIVSPQMADPVGSGFAQNLARPGGNITGLTTLSAELGAKRLEILKEIVPSLSRAGMVWDQDIPSFALLVKQTEAAAAQLHIALDVHGVRSPAELEAALTAIESWHAQGLVVAVPSTSTVSQDTKMITSAIARHHLPAIYIQGESVSAGGLMSYGPNYPDLFRRVAIYVDKILKDARPAELPIEAPTLFELRVNLKAAKALDITVPQSVMLRADQVIE